MIVAILSILIITLAVWRINKWWSFQVCPICAGVALTWGWMLGGIVYGFLLIEKYEILVAVLMGASIGGIVTELKKIFPKFRSKTKNTEVEEIKKQLDQCC